jgi:hypothetical protein
MACTDSWEPERGARGVHVAPPAARQLCKLFLIVDITPRRVSCFSNEHQLPSQNWRRKEVGEVRVPMIHSTCRFGLRRLMKIYTHIQHTLSTHSAHTQHTLSTHSAHTQHTLSTQSTHSQHTHATSLFRFSRHQTSSRSSRPKSRESTGRWLVLPLLAFKHHTVHTCRTSSSIFAFRSHLFN